MRRIKNFFKETIIWFMVFAMVSWSVSVPFTTFVKSLWAAGGIDAQYTNDGGATPDVYLNATTTPEAIIKIKAYDTGAGILDSVTVQLEPGWNCTMANPPVCTESAFSVATDLGAISTTTTSGISLWRDNGDGSFNSGSDTLVSSTTPTKAGDWTTQIITDDWGSFTVSQTVFSNLNLTLPTSFSSQLALFVVVRAEANLDATPLRSFMPKIPQNGVNVTGGTLTDWPSESMGRMFPQVMLGAEGSGNNMQMSSPLVISEVQIASSTANIEFIEIYNKTDQPIDLFQSLGANSNIGGDLNLHILDCAGGSCTGTTTNKTLTLKAPANDTVDDIPAKGYFLIASTDWNTAHSGVYGAADATYDASTNGLTANGGVYISASSTVDVMVIDKVGWGSPQTAAVEGMAAVSAPANGSLERKAYPNSTPTSMTTGIDQNKGNGSDSNNNSGDFITRPAGGALPQTSASAIETDVISANDRNIVINEILYNTATSTGWIELFNASSTAISINTWTIEIGTSTQTTFTLPNITMQGQSFVTVYWNNTTTPNDTDTSDGSGSVYTGALASVMSTMGGDVTLKNGGTIVDYVQYGGAGKAGAAAAAAVGQWTLGDYKPNCEYNQSIARAGTTGDDHNNSGDWVNMSTPTPNIPNMGGDSTAPDAATNAQLSDPDSANYGLDGQDVRFVWTPSSTSDPGFDRYDIYLLPDGTALNTSAHAVYTTFYGQYMWESGTKAATISFTGGGYSMSFDSAGNALTNGNYRAYVVSVDMAGNKSASVSSAAATLTAETGGTDSNPPMVDHMPVWQAPAGAGLTFYARMGDDRTLATAELAYKTTAPNTNWGIATSTCVQPAMAGNTGLYACSVAWNGGWGENTTLSYYLRAIDATGNDSFIGMYWTGTESEAKTNSINVDFIASASWNDAGTTADLSGTVLDSTGNPIQDAFIIIDGISTTTATTTSSGSFTIPDNAMPSGNQFMRIIKNGYMEKMTDTDANSNFIVRGAANLSFYMNTGYMSNSAGGSSGGNGVSWTAPGDNMMGAPTNIACTGDCSSISAGQTPIIVGFFNAMNSATIDDMDAGNAGSNIYLTSDGVTKVSGIKVKYASGNNEARIYSSTALSPNTFYTVVITPSVLDTNGNPIMSNRPSGNYEFSFSAMGDNSSMWGGGGNDYSGFGGGGMMMPPYVVGTNPTPGSYNIPLSTSISVEFSEAMDPGVTNAVKLYRITSVGSWTGTEVAATASLDNATKKIVTLNPNATLNSNSANSGWYEVRVLASAKNQMGIWMGNPGSCGGVSPDTCLAATTHYSSSFQVGADSDSTAPTVAGTYPANNDGITAGTVAVDVAIPAIEIGFSESMNPSSINSQNITLKKGTVSIAGTVKYDPMSNGAKFMPTGALTANSVYTLTIAGTGSSGVADMSGNYLAANSITSFKTGNADTSAPNVMFGNGDDYQFAITFSEPMNIAPITDTANWATSVLNPANYFINSLQSEALCATPGSWACSPALVAPYNTSGGNQLSGLNNITLTYDSVTQTVAAKGYDMCSGLDFAACVSDSFQIFIDNVTDKSGNPLTDSGNRAASPTHGNATRAFLQNSAETYGMLGPGGGGGTMMGGGGPGGSGSGTGPGMDMGQMGMFKGGAFPMNAMAGQTSGYMIDIPVTKALQDGMLITVTFPAGFNTAGVSKDAFSPINNDMNEWNGGTVNWDTTYGVGGIASTSNNSVTIKLNIATTSSNMLNTTAGPDGYIDFLHIDIKGIVNSSIPKDFGTSGYTVDIKTKSADGALLENISTMPFFITQGGSDSLTVIINSGNASQNTGTMTVYLGSWMTGPMEAETSTFTNGYATSTFSNLVSGEYMIFTDPFITIGSNNYLGKPMPEPATVSGVTSKTISLESEGAGANKVVVYAVLNGNFSTGGVADDVDIFANSPAGFRVKTLNDLGNAANATSTFYLTEGDWWMGIGPAMPKGPMAGPPPMPDWMMPQMLNLTVAVETATGRTLGGAANGNNNPLLLTTASTDYFRVGDTVSFSDGGATSTITSLINNTSITVTPVGNWGATIPNTNTVISSVRESSATANDGAVRFDISGQSLKNIIGYVLDDTGNGVGNAEVYAYQPQGFGGGHTTTDTAGKFTLKVGNNGVWTVGAFKQGMPNAKEKSVDVRDNSVGGDGNTTADVYSDGAIISDTLGNNAGTNPLRLKLKRPAYTISGKVLNSAGQAVPSAPVWAYQPSSWGHADAMTDSSGNYILYVDAGTWRVETDAPGVGWMQYSPDVTITTASQSNINLRPASDATFYSVSGTITIDGSTQSYTPLRAVKYDASGNYLGRDFGASTDSNGLFTFSLPEGYYRIDTWTPNYGEVELVYDQIANSPANINVNAATTTANITVASGDLQTVSIQFTNGTAAQTGFLHIEEVDFSGAYPKPTGYRLDKRIDGLSATTTVKLKGAAAGKYYFFDLDVPGLGFYMPDSASRLLLSNTKDCIKLTDAARDVYFTLPNASTGVITVAGTVTDGSPVANAWVWLGNPNSNFHTGTETAADGTFTLTVPKLGSGNYKLGADKPGYMSPAPANVSATTASAGNTITLTTYSLSISGRVYADADADGAYDSGETLPNGWVWAEETTSKIITHAPADATGAYSLGVTAGNWQVYAGTDGYTDGAYKVNNTKTPVTVTAASVPNINVALTANANWTTKAKSKPITPSSGGTVDDTGSSGTGVKLTVPPNALGSDSNSGNISIQETSAVAETASAEPLGGTGKTVTATDNSGNAVTNLNDYIDVELVYYKADIEAMNVVDYSKLKNLSESYWDNTLNNWVNLSTTRKAYYKLLEADTEWTLKADSATQTGFEEFIDTLAAGTPTYYDYKLVLTAKSNHLTVFGATMPQDGLYPASPTGLSQSSGSGSSVALSWTAVTTNLDATAITDLLGYEVYRSTDGTTYTQRNTSDIATNSYSDSATAWTSYYYKVTAADDGGNETALASSTALQVCSNKTVSNGTVAANCAITCNTGYTLSGNSCNAAGGSVFIPGGGGSNNQTTKPQATTTTEIIKEEIKEIITDAKETTEKAIETTKETVNAYAQKIVNIATEAGEIIKANINSLLGKFGFKRELAKEQTAVKKYVKELIKDVSGVSKDSEYALTNFVAYGTPTTQILGEGERAGVVNSYKSAFGKLPDTEEDWNDVIKIGNGRWPSETNALSEANATEAFKKIYLRNPDRTNPHDDAAVTVIAYGLRPSDRNLDSEKAAIKIFKAIYGYNPKSAAAWDIVRAIAYSGATR